MDDIDAVAVARSIWLVVASAAQGSQVANQPLNLVGSYRTTINKPRVASSTHRRSAIHTTLSTPSLRPPRLLCPATQTRASGDSVGRAAAAVVQWLSRMGPLLPARLAMNRPPRRPDT